MIDWCSVVIRSCCTNNSLPGQRGDPSSYRSLIIRLSLFLSFSSSFRRLVDLPKVTASLLFAPFSALGAIPRADLAARLVQFRGRVFWYRHRYQNVPTLLSLSLSFCTAVLLPFSLPLSAIRLSFTVSCDMSTSQYHARHLFPIHTSSRRGFQLASALFTT